MRRKHTAALSVMLLGGTLALAGCNSGSEPSQFEPNVAAMVITANAIDYTATTQAGGFGGQVVPIQDGAVFLTAKFLKSGGTQDFNITADDFELRAAGNNAGGPLPTGVTFERSGAFSGTVTGLTAGQSVPVYFSLYHKSQTHSDFGPYFLTITRSADTGGGGGGTNF